MNMPDRGQVTVDSAGALPERPRVEVTTTSPHGDQVTRTVEGDDAWVGASLRSLADRLDPPRPPRPGLRDLDPNAGTVRRGPTGGLVSVPPPSEGRRRDPMSTQ